LVLGQYIFVAAEKDKAVGLQKKVNNFEDRLMVELTIDIGAKQGLLFVPDIDCPTCLMRGIRCHGK